MRKAKTEMSLDIQSSLPDWRKIRSLATHTAHNEDSEADVLTVLSRRCAHMSFCLFCRAQAQCKISCVVIHDTHSLISSFVVSWLTGVGRFSILVCGGRGVGGWRGNLSDYCRGIGGGTNHFQNYWGGGGGGAGWHIPDDRSCRTLNKPS